jgi:hypothetical protein
MSLFPQSTADADWVFLSSGKSRGVGTTNIKATLFMRDESARLCVCCAMYSGKNRKQYRNCKDSKNTAKGVSVQEKWLQ